MHLLVNVDLDWGIGRSGDLLVNLAADMQHFRQLTTGKTIILGRKTLATFPQGQPLPKRTNIFLTKDQDFVLPSAIVCHSLAHLAGCLAGLPQDELLVVGGSSIYRQLLPYCHMAHVTQLKHSFAADRFFPNLDLEPAWQLQETGPWQKGVDRSPAQAGELTFRFCLYVQKEPREFGKLGGQA